MPKSAEQQPDETSSTAITPNAYADLVAKVANANNSLDAARSRKSELIADAVESKNLHKGAFAWVMRLRAMDPVKRNEFLFHFDLYCEREAFAREDLLADRAVQGAADDGEEDLRPRHLRQPGASAASTEAVDKIKADALSKVGRGPEHKPN